MEINEPRFMCKMVDKTDITSMAEELFTVR